MCEYHSQLEDEATITSILGTVFPAEKEKETMAFCTKLDEEEFEPLVEEGELPSIPTEEELIKYPELEYSGREVQAIVKKMDRVQKQEFHEYEQYFLTRYRQTGNMKPLCVEVRNIVREMCPSMPGQMQDAVVEARAQLLAEVKLKELCKQLRVPAPRYEPPSMVHPIDEGILGEKAVTHVWQGVTRGTSERRPTEYIKGGPENNSNTGHNRSEERSKTPGTTEVTIRHDTRCYESWR